MYKLNIRTHEFNTVNLPDAEAAASLLDGMRGKGVLKMYL